MSTNKSHVHHAAVAVNRYYETIVVAFDIEHYLIMIPKWEQSQRHQSEEI
jgi:hypothetical protein